MKSGISIKEAVEFLKSNDKKSIDELFSAACEVRKKSFGQGVEMCSIINARCGGCPEDCAFCAQSGKADSKVDYYSLISSDEMFDAASNAAEYGASRIGIVTSGRSVKGGAELDAICDAVTRITNDLPIKPCASLGLMDISLLKELKDAGLKRFHNNLETARSYFSTICGTRSYDDQIRTIESAKEVGLEVCCGGIFGMGESYEQRVEMLDTIRDLEIECVPINLLTPIPGTRLEGANYLTPLEVLKIIAVAKLMMPATSIRVCGGREFNLQERQDEIFKVGADAFMVGGYLVTPGGSVDSDKEMILSAGFTY